MHDMRAYHIEVEGEVDETALNTSGPIQVRVRQTNLEITRLTALADQSGLIGLLRHLHQQGFVLLSVSREHENYVQEVENENSRCP